jgi:hypothetical protein
MNDEWKRATKIEMTFLCYRQDVVISAFAQIIGGKIGTETGRSCCAIV